MLYGAPISEVTKEINDEARQRADLISSVEESWKQAVKAKAIMKVKEGSRKNEEKERKSKAEEEKKSKQTTERELKTQLADEERREKDEKIEMQKQKQIIEKLREKERKKLTKY